MFQAEIANAVQLLDLMLEFFADDGHWTRGRYDDGNGGHCLVGALLHLSRKYHLPTAPVIALLQDAMPRPGLPLVHFNDACCGSAAELRSIILKARRLAHDHSEQARAAEAVDHGFAPDGITLLLEGLDMPLLVLVGVSDNPGFPRLSAAGRPLALLNRCHLCLLVNEAPR